MILPLLLAAFAFADAGLDSLLSQKIDHFALAHRRSLRAARDFDRELDEALADGRPGFLARSSAYRQLQALRVIKEADAAAIGSAMAELEPAAQARAENIFADKLAAAGPAAEALAGELRAHFGIELPERAAREDSSPALTLLPGLLDLEIAGAAAAIDFAPADLPKVRPGTGPEGNLTGGNFPANTWALTFDDGPSGKYTKQVVDQLTAHGKKASFFWLAENVNGNRAVIQYARAAGMSLNDHSFTHADLSKASAATLDHEIVESAALEARFYGQRPEFFRCPYGAGTRKKEVRELIAAEGMVHVFWNVDSLDWQDKDPASILARVKKEMALEKKGIILFHDIHPQSLAASTLLLDYAATRPELRWVTIPEIRDELNRRP